MNFFINRRSFSELRVWIERGSLQRISGSFRHQQLRRHRRFRHATILRLHDPSRSRLQQVRRREREGEEEEEEKEGEEEDEDEGEKKEEEKNKKRRSRGEE